jgi:hypothetical protein
VTLNDRIEQSSFSYDPDFPPDVPEGMPLSSACRKRAERPSTLKRALHGCVRLVTVARRA